MPCSRRALTSTATSALRSSAIRVPLINVALIVQTPIIHWDGMVLLLILWQIASAGSFETNLGEALNVVQSGDWQNAARRLDAASAADPEKFSANNLAYLRGRAAENLRDWNRAADEFQKIPPGGALRPLAAWHAARAVLHLGNVPQAQSLISE